VAADGEDATEALLNQENAGDMLPAFWENDDEFWDAQAHVTSTTMDAIQRQTGGRFRNIPGDDIENQWKKANDDLRKLEEDETFTQHEKYQLATQIRKKFIRQFDAEKHVIPPQEMPGGKWTSEDGVWAYTNSMDMQEPPTKEFASPEMAKQWVDAQPRLADGSIASIDIARGGKLTSVPVGEPLEIQQAQKQREQDAKMAELQAKTAVELLKLTTTSGGEGGATKQVYTEEQAMALAREATQPASIQPRQQVLAQNAPPPNPWLDAHEQMYPQTEQQAPSFAQQAAGIGAQAEGEAPRLVARGGGQGRTQWVPQEVTNAAPGEVAQSQAEGEAPQRSLYDTEFIIGSRNKKTGNYEFRKGKYDRATNNFVEAGGMQQGELAITADTSDIDLHNHYFGNVATYQPTKRVRGRDRYYTIRDGPERPIPEELAAAKAGYAAAEKQRDYLREQQKARHEAEVEAEEKRAKALKDADKEYEALVSDYAGQLATQLATMRKNDDREDVHEPYTQEERNAAADMLASANVHEPVSRDEFMHERGLLPRPTQYGQPIPDIPEGGSSPTGQFPTRDDGTYRDPLLRPPTNADMATAQEATPEIIHNPPEDGTLFRYTVRDDNGRPYPAIIRWNPVLKKWEVLTKADAVDTAEEYTRSLGMLYPTNQIRGH
jgi:hypothetical protein